MLDRLRLSDVRRMAGLRTFRLGEAAYEQHAVTRVVRRGGILHGEVRDRRGGSHRVEIRPANGDLRLHCNCANEAEETCEHLVAVLLWWLEEGREPPQREAAVALEDVERALRRRRRGELVEMLLELALRDDGIMTRLELEAAAATGKSVDVRRYKQMIRNALSRRFVDYYHTGDYLQNLEALREDLDRLRAAGRPREAHACLAYFLEKALDRYREVEDADLRLFEVIGRAIEAWGTALAAAQREPGAAAQEVFDLVDPSDASFLEPLVRAAAHGLGGDGLKALEALGRERLENARRAPAAARATVTRRKWRHLLMTIARVQGDDARYLAVLREDLQGSTDYLLAAERLQALGRIREAASVAREGLEASPRRDTRLLLLLSRLAERSGDVEAALAHARDAFEESPSEEVLARVTGLARRLGAWKKTHRHVLARLRRDGGSPMLLEFLLEEGQLEEALREAKKRRYPEAILEKLAARAEATRPEDAARLWRELLDRHAATRSHEGDRRALAAARRLADLWRRTGKGAEVERLRRELRRRWGSRRSLVAPLESALGG